MRQNNVIVLYRHTYGGLVGGEEQWYAAYQGPHSRAVEKAFGTCIVPTAFTGTASVETVRAAIAALNPGITIEVNI